MIETKYRNYFNIYIIGLVALLAIRDIAGVSFSKFLLVIYCLGFLAYAPVDCFAPMLCFTFPLTWGLPYTYIYFGAICLFWLKRKKVPGRAFACSLFFLSLEFIASIWYIDTDYALILKYISTLTIFFTFLYDDYIDKKSCVRAFYIGSIVLCVIILITTFKSAPSNWLYLFSKGWFRFGSKQAENIEGMMISVNANTLAYYSIVGICLSYSYLPDSKGKERWFYLSALALFTVSGVLTVSISWMLVFVVCSLLFVFTQTRSPKAVILTAIGMISAFLIARIALSRTPELLTAFTTRLTTVDLSTGDARTDLMLDYHNAFWNNPRFIFLGTGVTQYRQITNISNSFHNMIQQIFVSYGVIAGIIFFVGILSPIRNVGRHSTVLLDWLPMIGVLVFTQTIQFINPESLMLPYVIAYFWLITRAEKGRENDEALYNNG